MGATFRWQASYPANSGAYVGTVESINDLDLTLNYAPHYMDRTVFSLLVSNVYNREQQYFVGAPLWEDPCFQGHPNILNTHTLLSKARYPAGFLWMFS